MNDKEQHDCKQEEAAGSMKETCNFGSIDRAVDDDRDCAKSKQEDPRQSRDHFQPVKGFHEPLWKFHNSGFLVCRQCTVSDIKIRIICESVANQNPDFDKDQQATDKKKKERCSPGILL